MAPISDSIVLAMWERALREHPVDRALTLLSIGEGGGSRVGFAALSLAERDQRLMALAAAMFGPTVTLVAECPDCNAETELSFAADALGNVPGGDLCFEHDGQTIPYRRPNSRDLAAALSKADPGEARRVFLGALIDTPDAPDAMLDQLDTALADHAGPEALTLGYACSGCAKSRSAPFDILDYVWRRITARARRTLYDIHTLAGAYGWSSADILSLSPDRRAAHIAMVTT